MPHWQILTNPLVFKNTHQIDHRHSQRSWFRERIAQTFYILHGTYFKYLYTWTFGHLTLQLQKRKRGFVSLLLFSVWASITFDIRSRNNNVFIWLKPKRSGHHLNQNLIHRCPKRCCRICISGNVGNVFALHGPGPVVLLSEKSAECVVR